MLNSGRISHRKGKEKSRPWEKSRKRRSKRSWMKYMGWCRGRSLQILLQTLNLWGQNPNQKINLNQSSISKNLKNRSKLRYRSKINQNSWTALITSTLWKTTIPTKTYIKFNKLKILRLIRSRYISRRKKTIWIQSLQIKSYISRKYIRLLKIWTVIYPCQI